MSAAASELVEDCWEMGGGMPIGSVLWYDRRRGMAGAGEGEADMAVVEDM